MATLKAPGGAGEPQEGGMVPAVAEAQSQQQEEQEEEMEVVDAPRIMSLFIASNLWTILMTFLPVLVDFSDTLYRPHQGWYTGDDIIRLLEPIVALPLNFWILHASGIFQTHRPKSSPTAKTGGAASSSSTSLEPYISVSIFMVGAAIYEQGAGFHSASNMFKHPIEMIREEHKDIAELSDLYVWARTVWEHEVSHYMYAIGGLIMAGVHAWAFRHTRIPGGLHKTQHRVLWCTAVILYTIIITGVAIEFPYGLVACLVFLVVYGFGVVGWYVFRQTGGDLRATLCRWGERLVLQYFLWSYILSFLLVIAWIAKEGGIQSRNGN